MEAEFWHSRWEKNEIGFHENAPNRMLTAHFSRFLGNPSGRIFVPLCGKSQDLPWLRAQGYEVAGAELSQTAVEQFFQDLGETPEIAGLGAVRRYRSDRITVFAGDIFDLTSDMLGPVVAVYDRAAFVALPEETRPRYAEHVARITDRASQFLITLEYDQSVMNGPPFSVTEEEVAWCYCAQYDRTQIARAEVQGGLKGRCFAMEVAWHLQPKPIS